MSVGCNQTYKQTKNFISNYRLYKKMICVLNCSEKSTNKSVFQRKCHVRIRTGNISWLTSFNPRINLIFSHVADSCSESQICMNSKSFYNVVLHFWIKCRGKMSLILIYQLHLYFRAINLPWIINRYPISAKIQYWQISNIEKYPILKNIQYWQISNIDKYPILTNI